MAGLTRTVTLKLLSTGSSAVTADLNRTGAALDHVQGRGKAAMGALGGMAATSGMFGPLGGTLGTVSASLAGVEGVGKRAGATMMGMGVAAMAAGLLMTKSAEKDVQSHKQLEAAIRASGHAYEPYKAGIEQAVHAQERYGHTADDTQEALRKLTQATNDPTKAMRLMGTTANLAAAQHISLADASTQVARVLSGHGGRVLMQYGIQMDTSIKDPTARGAKALDELSKKLDGQASASVDSFGGKMKVLKTRAEDAFNVFAAKAGPILTVVGPGLAVVGSIAEVMGARSARALLAMSASNVQASASTAVLAKQELTAAGSANAMAIATARATVANDALGGSSKVAATGMGRFAGAANTAGLAAAAIVGLTWGAKALGDAMSTKTSPSVTKLTADLNNLAATGARGKELDKFFGGGKFVADFKSATDSSLWGSAQRAMGAYADKVGPAASLLMVFGKNASQAKQRNTELAASLAQLTPEAATQALAQLTKGMNPQAVQRFKDELIKINPALDGILNSSDGAAGGMGKVGTAGRAAALALKVAADAAGYVDRAFKSLSGSMGVDTSFINAKQAAVALGAALRSNGKDFSLSTEKGQANRTALIGAAKSAMDLRQSYIDSGRGSDAANAAYNRAVGGLRAQMTAAGLTKAQIDALLGRYTTYASRPAALPTVGVKDQATPALRNVRALMDSLNGDVSRVSVLITTTDVHRTVDSAHPGGFAAGGMIGLATGGPSGYLTGSGTSTSDSIPTLLSTGEYVQKASAVAKYGRSFMDAVNAGTYNPGDRKGPSVGTVINVANLTLPSVRNAEDLVRQLNAYARQKGGRLGLVGAVTV